MAWPGHRWEWMSTSHETGFRALNYHMLLVAYDDRGHEEGAMPEK